MSMITRILPDNPVLTKELRVRMRGARAYWIIFGYLSFLALVLLVQYAAWLSRVQFNGGASDASRLGTDIFNMIIVTQVFLVLFITPAITSGALTIEREQQTMDLLTLTRLPRHSIITGKLLAAAAFTALLLVSSLPLISICFMLGSIDPMMVFSYYCMMLFGSLMIGAMGLMWSSLAKTTTQAVMFTYASLFVLFCIVGGLFGINSNTYRGGSLLENLFVAVAQPAFGTKFFNKGVFEGFGFSVFCLLFTVLMGAVAMSRLEMYPERKGGLLRGMAAFILGLLFLMANVWWLDAWYNRAQQAVQVNIQPPALMLIIPATLLMLLVPIYATGEWTDDERRSFFKSYLAGFGKRGLKTGTMSSGLAYMISLCLLSFAMYALAFALFHKTGDIFKTIGSYTYTNPYQMYTAGGQTLPQTAHISGSIGMIFAVITVSVIGFALLCQFFSTLFRNRWVGWLFGNVFLGMLWIMPALGFISTPPDVRANLFALNPAYVLLDMTDAMPQVKQLDILAIFPNLSTAAIVMWAIVGGVSLILTRFLVKSALAPAPKRDVIATVQVQ